MKTHSEDLDDGTGHIGYREAGDIIATDSLLCIPEGEKLLWETGNEGEMK